MSNSAYVRSVLSQKFTAININLSQEELVDALADIILQLQIVRTKTVSMIGGAASGKTTITQELIDSLRTQGLAVNRLSTDNYVVGDRTYRQIKLKNADAQKKYDFELMDEHIRTIRQLANDRTVTVPIINTKTGIAVDDKHNYTQEISKLDVLIIEGDFPRDDYDIRFYLHLPDEQRLQTNIEREAAQSKSFDAGELTARFNDRQRTLHKPYTLPALQTADYVLVADGTNTEWQYALYQRNQ